MPRRLSIVIGLAAAIVVGAGLWSLVRSSEQGGTSAHRTPWGDPDLQGIWNDDFQTPLQRPAQYANKVFFTEQERADVDRQRESLSYRDQRAQRGTEKDVAGAYNTTFTSMRPTGKRTSLIVDPTDGRKPPLTPDAQTRADAERAFQLALLQATDTCKGQESGCAGGKYGPPSARRADVPPFYNTGRLNRADGPEDRSMAERCMAGVLPDFGRSLFSTLQRIVQSPSSVSIFYETGQGQGWQRMIPVDGSPHLPQSVRRPYGDSRGHWEGTTLVVDVTNYSPKSNYEGARENLHLVE